MVGENLAKMTERDAVLGLLDDLLAIAEGTQAAAVDVRADGFSVALRRQPGARSQGAAKPAEPSAPAVELVQVRAPTVGMFSTSRDWSVGDRVEAGAALGAVQSLGHMAEIASPCTGQVRAVLAANGAPVEYGQALFSLERD
jgi:acetyl-CoA carboxylase biotin carboxyl carrier protein